LEALLREKHQLTDKLRREIADTKKQSLEYVRLLKNDSLKQEQAEREKTLNADIKWLHEKIKSEEAKKAHFANALEKQRELIQRMEKDLATKYNYDKNEIENMRNRILNAQPPPALEEESDEELEPVEARDDIFLQARTPETYHLFMNELKLYRKLEKDYEAKIELLAKERQEAEQRNFASRNKLLEVEYVPRLL
jgi:hypothetical protein